VSVWGQVSDNRITFDVWRTHLPDGSPPVPTVELSPDAVWVTLADLDDLAYWVEVAGGVVHRSPEFEGLRVWTLHVDTGPECRGLHVRVSVVARADAQVMHTVLAAVA
jgi:hypothetical protein